MVEQRKIIAFSPPDITEAEITAVSDALRSGWITTGPRTKELEEQLLAYTGAAGLAALNSATSALECALRLCGIGAGDEVIVPAYTYTATASSVIHVGAIPVLVDVAPGGYHIDASAVGAALTSRTKAVIPVDIAGIPADYEALLDVLDQFSTWQPANKVQACFSRPLVIADAAHALGASYKGVPVGAVADFTAFSFHAVKNFTTAEGGALAWHNFGECSEELYKQAMLLSLHGQNKDALHKDGAGNWEYDIEFPGYKWNLTDIQAALGLGQLKRYPGLLSKRQQLVERYQENLAASPVELAKHFGKDYVSSAHLMLVRIQGFHEEERNAVIRAMGQRGVSCNVHYKPLPLLSAYKKLGFAIEDFPWAYAQYENEITLPLHTLLSLDDIDYICQNFVQVLEGTA